MKRLTSFILFLALASCQETIVPIATLENGLVSVNTSDVKDTVEIKLSDLIEDVEIIQLDSKIEAYVHASQFYNISDNYILGTDGKQIKLFDRKTGKLITNVGGLGNGPGEYKQYVSSFQIYEKRNAIYIIDGFGARWINEYDLQGEFIRRIPLADKRAVPYSNILIDEEKDIVSIFTIPQNSVVWQQDFEGNFITDRAVIKQDPKKNKTAFTRVRDNSFDISTTQFYNMQDTLYRYDKENHIITPKFTVNVEGYSVCESVKDTRFTTRYYELPRHFIARISEGDMFKGGKGSSKHIIINKENLSGSYFNLINDFVFSSEIPYLITSGDYFIIGYEAEKLMEITENATEEQRKNMDSKLLEKLDNLYDNMDEESNATILIGKFKQ
ncbi:MAG: 6-bladed beta-propeller [Rikenellaceae bacterium]